MAIKSPYMGQHSTGGCYKVAYATVNFMTLYAPHFSVQLS